MARRTRRLQRALTTPSCSCLASWDSCRSVSSRCSGASGGGRKSCAAGGNRSMFWTGERRCSAGKGSVNGKILSAVDAGRRLGARPLPRPSQRERTLADALPVHRMGTLLCLCALALQCETKSESGLPRSEESLFDLHGSGRCRRRSHSPGRLFDSDVVPVDARTAAVLQSARDAYCGRAVRLEHSVSRAGWCFRQARYQARKLIESSRSRFEGSECEGRHI